MDISSCDVMWCLIWFDLPVFTTFLRFEIRWYDITTTIWHFLFLWQFNLTSHHPAFCFQRRWLWWLCAALLFRLIDEFCMKTYWYWLNLCVSTVTIVHHGRQIIFPRILHQEELESNIWRASYRLGFILLFSLLFLKRSYCNAEYCLLQGLNTGSGFSAKSVSMAYPTSVLVTRPPRRKPKWMPPGTLWTSSWGPGRWLRMRCQKKRGWRRSRLMMQGQGRLWGLQWALVMPMIRHNGQYFR